MEMKATIQTDDITGYLVPSSIMCIMHNEESEYRGLTPMYFIQALCEIAATFPLSKERRKQHQFQNKHVTNKPTHTTMQRL